MTDPNSLDPPTTTERPTGNGTVQKVTEGPFAGAEADLGNPQDIEKIVNHWKNYIILDERATRAENTGEWLKLLHDAIEKAGFAEADLNRALGDNPRNYIEALYEERSK